MVTQFSALDRFIAVSYSLYFLLIDLIEVQGMFSDLEVSVYRPLTSASQSSHLNTDPPNVGLSRKSCIYAMFNQMNSLPTRR